MIDIEAIQNIIERFRQEKKQVELRIIGDGEAREKLILAAEKAGAQVVYFGKVYNQQKKIELLGECDFGLNLMKEDVAVGLTIKSVDYLSMGIPIINSIKGDTMELVKRKEVGINYYKDSDSWLNSALEADLVILSRKAFQCFTECFTREVFKHTIKEAMEIQ